MADSDCEELSVIGDKGEIRFIDFEVDQSVASYNPNEEGPVTVSVPFPFVEGKPPSVPVNEVAAASFTIQNMTDEYVIINGVNIHASNPEDSFILSLMKPPSGQPDDISKEDFVGSFSMEDRSLKPHDVLTVWLSCLPKELGIFTTIVHIDFGGDTFQDDRIERVVFLLAEDKVSKDMVSGKPYQRGWRKKTAFAMDSYVTGVRPSRPMKRHFKNRLPEYKIPKDVRELIENKEIPEVVLQGLTRINYASYFRTLLIMEELRIEEDMKAYYMECVTLRRKGRYFLGLMVPGLAERRPSLVHGDAVYVKLANDDNGKAYEGCIHRVEADEVLLQFADMFHRLHNEDNLYNVRFAYNRVNFRRLYQAIESAEVLHRRFLFPTEYDGKRRITAKNLQPISHFLNTEQANAVRLILGCRGGAPYVIHGPPGTGKTKTLVEVILQLCKTRQNCRILVCASSNCAADHILEKMLSEGMQVNENEIFRLNATSRPFEDINPDYWKFCCYEEDQIFLCPSLDSLRSYRIIITTYMSASSLYAGGVKNNHFSHIILDEAGQASEPETMIPISNLCDKNTVIVLAGDPMQLGPVVHSKDAEAFGLGRSYLERLFESELYCSEDPNYVTMLVKNYRSHPEILSLSSRLFYKGALIPSREENEASLRWADLLPNSEFPVVFFGIQGMDEREGSNPSWFNRIEASKVVELIKKLISREVPEHDIGVITPYRQQVAKIKNALESLNMPDIKIGSVEQFQGQEREVIIVSTVRSTVKHNEFDKTFCLGFLSNPKRFNVAMTRARSLLIIVGNPHIISKDWYWEQMLWHCTDNNSYQGCALPVKEQAPYNGVGNWSSGGEEESKVGNPTNNWDQTAVSWGSGGEEESKVDEDTSKAVKDEDEWSDGWK